MPRRKVSALRNGGEGGSVFLFRTDVWLWVRKGAFAALLTGLIGVACTTIAPGPTISLPDPLQPPVPGTGLSGAAEKAARASFSAVSAGDSSRASARLARIPAGHPVRELLSLEIRFAKGEAVAPATRGLALQWPSYASAWHLTALAARREGDLRSALEAARRGSSLRAGGELAGLASEIEGEYVSGALSEGRRLLAGGDASGAVRAARELYELVPTAQDALLLETRALLALGESARAAAVVFGLSDTPEAMELKGRVAEAQQQWELAQQLYRELPDDYPGRCDLIRNAWEKWRLGLAPPYLVKALEGTRLTRRALAVILTWEVPSIFKRGSGSVPVFEDVVGLPEGSEIVAVARAGVVPGDPLARRFGPNRRVSPAELARALERLTALLGRTSPRWCGEGESADCTPLPLAVDGPAVVELIRTLVGEEDAPCSRS